jgi:hypothetical protein
MKGNDKSRLESYYLETHDENKDTIQHPKLEEEVFVSSNDELDPTFTTLEQINASSSPLSRYHWGRGGKYAHWITKGVAFLIGIAVLKYISKSKMSSTSSMFASTIQRRGLMLIIAVCISLYILHQYHQKKKCSIKS